MGSLMAGWDSHVSDSNLAKFRRNNSLTKGEIANFWKSKKLNEDEHLRDISLLSPRSQKIEANRRLETATSEPVLIMEDLDSNISLEKIIKKNGWWISSNSAFLNEPPVFPPDGTTHRYASQFHVAD